MKKLTFVLMFVAGLMFTASAAQAQSYQRVFNYNTGQWFLAPAGSPVTSNPPGFTTPGYANGYVYNPNNPDNGVVAGNYRSPGLNSTGNHGYMGPGSGMVPAAPPYVPATTRYGASATRYGYAAPATQFARPQMNYYRRGR